MTSASAEAPPDTSGCPLRDREARQERQQDQQETAGCGPRKATADSAAAPASRCPVDPSALSSPFLNPLNNIPACLSQQRSPGQKTKLPTERTVSSIPRGRLSAEESSKPQAEGEVRGGEAYGLGAKWEYPSPQQFYNALKRKGWETPEEHVETMVDIHNFLNEGAWEQVLEWEKAHDRQCCEPRSLLKFQGRPKDLTPKARLMMWLYGSPRPFDRHDWIVDRCGRQVRYVIDYYSAPEEAGNAPAFHLDVRPALDSPQAFLSRTKVGFWKAYERLTGRSSGNVPR